MVRIKNVFILLLVFTLFLICPAYPKSRKIRYLPSNTTMETVSKDYTNPADADDDSNFIVLQQLETRNCSTHFNGIAACRKCAKLRKKCPDCCLVDDDSGEKQIRCSESDTTGSYACKESLFQVDKCSQAGCGSQSGDSDECDENLECDEGISSGSPYGLQRRGCPEKDSGNLAPNGNCSEKEVTGSGLDRVWECDQSDYKPIDPGCNLTAEEQEALGRSKPTEYYSVVRIETICHPDCIQNECSADCPATSKGTCKYSTGTCMPSCEPICNAEISSGSSSGAGASCTPSGCGVSQSCTASCINKEDTCTAQECSSACGASFCESYSSRWPGSPPTFFIYTLTQEFKDYLTTCNDYADAYETCEDGITCCQENACRDKTPSGFAANCTKGDKCKQRSGCINAGFCNEAITEGQCIEKVRQAAECLIATEKAGTNPLSLEISSDIPYEFIARSGESLTIEWQVVLASLEEKEIEQMEGISFYTLVKVEEVGAAAGTSAAHVSMLNIRDMDNAFSIYGLTHVPKDELTASKKYEVKIYYFFPQAAECPNNPKGHAVKVKQLFLNIVKVKE